MRASEQVVGKEHTDGRDDRMREATFYDSDSLVSFVPSGYSVEKIYCIGSSPGQAHGCNQWGVLFINYIGHSNTGGLAHDLLVCNDLACNLDA